MASQVKTGQVPLVPVRPFERGGSVKPSKRWFVDTGLSIFQISNIYQEIWITSLLRRYHIDVYMDNDIDIDMCLGDQMTILHWLVVEVGIMVAFRSDGSLVDPLWRSRFLKGSR